MSGPLLIRHNDSFLSGHDANCASEYYEPCDCEPEKYAIIKELPPQPRKWNWRRSDWPHAIATIRGAS